MIRILNAEPEGYSDNARQILQSIGQLHEEDMDRERLLSEVGDFDVLIVRLRFQVDRALLDAGRRLRVVVTATTGLDHIDLDYARQKGIIVLSLSGEQEFLRGVTATAELAFGLLLALLRRIPQAFESVKHREWNRDAFRGHELSEKRLGIVGFGRLGQKVARYGMAFEMQVGAYDPYVLDWPADVRRFDNLDDLLTKSDVLSLHVVLNAETTKMIGQRELSLLPEGSIVVNTARGAVLDQVALIRALECRHLAGAALDVLDGEHDLRTEEISLVLEHATRHDNLLITPHIGGATYTSMSKTEIFMARKLADHLNSLPGVDVLDLESGTVNRKEAK